MAALGNGLPALDGADEAIASLPSVSDAVEPPRPGAVVAVELATPTATVAGSTAAPQPTSGGAPRARLEDIWPEPPRRKLPSTLRFALIAAAILLVVVVAFGHRGRSAPTLVSAAINDEMVVSAEDLKNRREVRAEDFRPKRRFVTANAPSPEPAAAPRLADRHARRQADPEDVLTLKTANRTAGQQPTVQGDGLLFQGPIYVPAVTSGRIGPSGPGAGNGEHLAAAGTSLPATLVTPLELRGSASTVIAQVDRKAQTLAGARFVGSASLSGNRVTMRFAKVLLVDGREARIDAEAQGRTADSVLL